MIGRGQMVLVDVGQDEVWTRGERGKDCSCKHALVCDFLKGSHPYPSTESIRPLLDHDNTGHVNNLKLNAELKFETLYCQIKEWRRGIGELPACAIQ